MPSGHHFWPLANSVWHLRPLFSMWPRIPKSPIGIILVICHSCSESECWASPLASRSSEAGENITSWVFLLPSSCQGQAVIIKVWRPPNNKPLHSHPTISLFLYPPLTHAVWLRIIHLSHPVSAVLPPRMKLTSWWRCFVFSRLQPALVTRFDLTYPGVTAANYLASLWFSYWMSFCCGCGGPSVQRNITCQCSHTVVTSACNSSEGLK